MELKPQITRRDVQLCIGCGRGVAHDHNMIFFRATLERFCLDQRGIMQEHGLEQFFGGGKPGAVLASVMGTNPPLAHRFGEPTTSLICLDCAMNPALPVTMVIERAEKVAEKKADAVAEEKANG